MNQIPAGWKNGKEHAGHDTLFKIFKTDDIETTFDYFERIKAEILNGAFRSSTFFTMSNDCLTITLNDIDANKTLDELIDQAKVIDSLILL